MERFCPDAPSELNDRPTAPPPSHVAAPNIPTAPPPPLELRPIDEIVLEYVLAELEDYEWDSS